MPLTQLAPPYPIFTDKSGSPLDNGYLYFGTVNLNPETNPITVYYDTAFTQPAAQPLRTSNGYVMRNGSPAAIYTNGYFSVTVRDKNKSLVIYSPSGYGITPGTSASLTDQMTYNEGGTGAVNRVLTSRLQDYVSVKDFGAVGDGTTDDTTAFKNAIAEAAGNFQHIFVPSGFYVISDTLNLNPNNASPIGGATGLFGTRVVGDETMATRILFKPASSTTPLFLIVGTSGNNTDQGVENIYIQPFDSSYNRMGIGVELRGACFANITNVYAIELKDGFNINNTGGAGVFSEFNLLRNCRTVYCTRGFVLDSSNGDTSFHGTNFDRCICNIGQTSGDKGLALIGTSGNSVYLYNSHVDIAFFGNNSATAYMIYGEYVSYALNTCSITCENNAAIYINNGNMGFKGRVDNTETITFSGNGIFVCDTYLFPKNATTNVLYSGHILEPVTNNFDQYIKSTATSAIFATRNGANQGLVASVPLGGSFVVGSNTTQDAANFAPMISLSLSQVISHAGGMILSAYDSTNALNQVVNINAQENANNGSVYPVTDNKPTLGIAARRWKEVFAVAGTINTSDEREKQDITNLDDVEMRVAVRLKGLIKKFRWKEAVAEKGDNARIHVGIIAQDVKSAFEAEGLDGFRYGVLCYDEWKETENYSAGNRYGVRYEELLSFIIAAL
jgi:hypothetical protein